ncbi:helix-turn-helix transcriptional regulator [Angustibacter luteus]|uniref:Helix-turn-helix transcriptional regulator n=1 Tax=Angustibacter luteus TaxID=658456 RepID=A0ABW1JFT6_9ACTN
MFARSVAEELAVARRERGWSMEQLAGEAGLHRTSVGLIERGERGVTLQVAARLAWALDLSLGDLCRAAEARAGRG